MNLSGQSVQRLAAYYKVRTADVLVLCDDAALPYGALRLRQWGSSGGHNGLESVETHLVTTHFPRLRMGIGQAEAGSLEAHVLARFNADEEAQLPDFLKRAAKGVRHWLQEPINLAMSRVNHPLPK